MNKVVHANCLDWLRIYKHRDTFDLIYIDPPFNTGKTMRGAVGSYEDRLGLDDYVAWMSKIFQAAAQVLKPSGSILVHCDQNASHYLKILLDGVFGRACFMNELIWSYDYGGRSKRYWPKKHDTIFWFVKDPKNYTYNYDAQKRVPYMAPGLCGPEKAARGKTQTDVIFHTIVPTQGNERTGYPTQKPVGLLEQFVLVHSNPDDRLLDFFAGSGSFGEAAAKHGRNFTLVDENPEAISVMRKRLGTHLAEDKADE